MIRQFMICMMLLIFSVHTQDAKAEIKTSEVRKACLVYLSKMIETNETNEMVYIGFCSGFINALSNAYQQNCSILQANNSMNPTSLMLDMYAADFAGAGLDAKIQSFLNHIDKYPQYWEMPVNAILGFPDAFPGFRCTR